jgi:riboflavin biosynthesis pyrimidine reductase
MQSYRFKQLSILFILSILLLEAGCNNSQVREFNQPNIIVVDSQYAATPKAKAIQTQKRRKTITRRYYHDGSGCYFQRLLQ